MSRRASKRQDTRRVELQSGGTVTISLDCSVFDLTGQDRDFVTQLIDMVRDYEAATIGRSKARESDPPMPKATADSDA